MWGEEGMSSLPSPSLSEAPMMKNKKVRFCSFPLSHCSLPTWLMTAHGAHNQGNQLSWGWKWQGEGSWEDQQSLHSSHEDLLLDPAHDSIEAAGERFKGEFSS